MLEVLLPNPREKKAIEDLRVLWGIAGVFDV
jgi:hypothetical protein